MRRFVWFFLALLVLGTVAVVTPIVYNLSQLLTPEELTAARARWEQRGPKDYDMRYLERIDQDKVGDVYEVKVRGGEVVVLRVNDEDQDIARLSREGLNRFAVPGLFDRIAAHLAEEAEGKKRNYATAYFDPNLGFPVRYVRRDRETKSRLEWIVKLSPAEGAGP